MRLVTRLPLFTHRFVLCGLNLERFMNTLQRQGVPLLQASRRDRRTLEGVCYSADLPAVLALAEEKGWRVQETAPMQLSAALSWLARRPGVPVGAALALALMIILSQFVWQVEIHQAGPYRADMAAYLQENGYRPGLLRKRVDASALERALTERYPQIAWFHVYVHGATLVVDVSQGVPMPEGPNTQPGDVVARRDGVVEMVNVYAGTAVVKPGDAVRQGQVLIRGAEKDRDGAEMPVAARGVVRARCWQSHRVAMPLYETLSGETGRETTSFRLCTPWLCWPGQRQEAPYLASNTYLSQTPVGGCFFPLWQEKVTRREVWLEYAPRDEQQVRKEAGQAALKALENGLYGYELIDKWVDYCMIEDNTLVATATAEWLMDIGGSGSP